MTQEKLWLAECFSDGVFTDGEPGRSGHIHVITFADHITDARRHLERYSIKSIIEIDLDDPKWSGLTIEGALVRPKKW